MTEFYNCRACSTEYAPCSEHNLCTTCESFENDHKQITHILKEIRATINTLKDSRLINIYGYFEGRDSEERQSTFGIGHRELILVMKNTLNRRISKLTKGLGGVSD